MRSYECPNCGAELKVKDGEETCYCEYCDSVIDVDDTIHIKNHYVDDARIKELEIERLKIENSEKKKREERAAYEAEKIKWKKILRIWIGALVITFVLSTLFSNQNIISQFFIRIFSAVLIFGGLGVFLTKPKERNQGQVHTSQAVNLPVTGQSGSFQKSDFNNRSFYTQTSSQKSKTTALILCVFLGIFGGHYFYVRRFGMGILYLFTYGLFFIGWVYDIIRIANGSFKDADGRFLAN